MAKRKTAWRAGAQFAVPLPDGTYGIGQAIALIEELGVVYCALSSRRITALPGTEVRLGPDEVVSCVALTPNELDHGRWPVLGYAKPVVAKSSFNNERFASKGYVGAKLYDAALAQDFLAAFHALTPWDDWHDPNYLDGWLRSPSQKPTNLVLRKTSNGGA